MTEIETTYNRQTVKAALLNRLIIIAGWVGIFIAGFLTYTHYAGVIPPCGANSSGCQTVQTSDFAKIAGIPVALIGLLGYILITGVAVARSIATEALWKRLSVIGLVLTGLGTGLSLFFMYVSFAMLQAKCNWCIASAVTMVVLFLLHGLLANEAEPETSDDKSKLDVMSLGVGLVLAVGLFGYFSQGLKQVEGLNIDFSKVSNSEIIPRDEKVMGNPDAPVMVVEFADINCPSCRRSHFETKQILEAAGEKVGYAFRNFPLYMIQGHEMSDEAALISEYAADNGKYYNFLDEAFKESNTDACKSLEGLIRIAGDAGLDSDEVRKILNEKTDEYIDKVAVDLADARAMGISRTPTIIVLADGVPPRAISPNQLADTLSRAPYRDLIQ